MTQLFPWTLSGFGGCGLKRTNAVGVWGLEPSRSSLRYYAASCHNYIILVFLSFASSVSVFFPSLVLFILPCATTNLSLFFPTHSVTGKK